VRERGRALIEAWYRAALEAVDPEQAVRRALRQEGSALVVQGQRVPVEGRLVVVGVGKAAVAMARGVEAVCGGLVDTGLVITKDGHAQPPLPRRIRVAEASHPIPDERGVAATREMLALLRELREGDVAIAVISGGGSALLEAPRPPVTLQDIAETTQLLLRAGAPIQALNAVRIPLSLVKGGGLRRAADAARMVTLIVSDVLGNDPQIIASGPTVASSASGRAALAVLKQYGVLDRVPRAVVDVLQHLPSEPPSWPFPDDIVAIVADNDMAVEAARAAAERDGFSARVIWRRREGEARDLGREWVDACAAASPDCRVLLGGGEATVTVRGSGIGGRNTEFAVAAALELERRAMLGWSVASLATDGQDGLTGVAGGIVDCQTCALARKAGIDPEAALANNDTLRVLEAAGAVVAPGPTGTNVNDVYLALRMPTG
jgi:glycerate 2-kinase